VHAEQRRQLAEVVAGTRALDERFAALGALPQQVDLAGLDDVRDVALVTLLEQQLSGRELDALRLAYATSIHKSQGSEYPAVVIPLQTSHFPMLSRNLLYTAVTRAKRLCVLVADPRALRIALGELRRERRSTGLSERLRAASGAGARALLNHDRR